MKPKSFDGGLGECKLHCRLHVSTEIGHGHVRRHKASKLFPNVRKNGSKYFLRFDRHQHVHNGNALKKSIKKRLKKKTIKNPHRIRLDSMNGHQMIHHSVHGKVQARIEMHLIDAADKLDRFHVRKYHAISLRQHQRRQIQLVSVRAAVHTKQRRIDQRLTESLKRFGHRWQLFTACFSHGRFGRRKCVQQSGVRMTLGRFLPEERVQIRRFGGRPMRQHFTEFFDQHPIRFGFVIVCGRNANVVRLMVSTAASRRRVIFAHTSAGTFEFVAGTTKVTTKLIYECA